MNPAYCVDCGTKRDASFIEPDGKCIAVHCLPCGTSLPCCPECGITGIRRTENQLALECPSCEVIFPDPKIEDDEWGITSKEMQFLLNVGEHLSSHISKLRSFDQYEEQLGREISETRYIGSELKCFVVIPSLLEWRRRVFSAKAVPGKAAPLDIDYIENKLLAENVHYKPTSRARSKTAGILKELLAVATALEILTPDCCSFTFCNRHYDRGKPQGAAIKFLIEEAKEGRPDVQVGPKRGEKIHTEMDIPEQSRVRDYFKDDDLWDYLIIKGKKQGCRRLVVYPNKYEIPTS